jgi:hypothetical protein
MLKPMRSLVLVGLVGAAVLGLAPHAEGAGNPALKRVMIMMNMQASAGTAKGLQMGFVQVKAWAKPDEFPKWAEIAEKGRVSSHAGNLEGAKKACTECHEQYREQFRNKYGSKSGTGKDKE